MTITLCATDPKKFPYCYFEQTVARVNFSHAFTFDLVDILHEGMIEACAN